MIRLKRLSSLATASVLSMSALFNLAFIPLAHAAADTCTWNAGGVDTNFSTAANWYGCDNGNVPEAGDSLVFPDLVSPSQSPINDLPPGTEFAGITFNHPQPGSYQALYTLTGNALGLADGATISVNANTGGAIQTFNLPISLNGNVKIATVGGSINFSNVVSGSGGFNKSGANQLTLAGNNTFSGAVSITGGNVFAQHLNALGTAAGGTTVTDGGALLYGNIGASNPKIAEPFTLAGNGADSAWGDYALGLIDNSTYTFSGPLALTANTEVGGDKSTIKFTGSISGNFAISVGKSFPLTLVLDGSSNSSLTANGTYRAPVDAQTLADAQPTVDIFVGYNQTFTVDGSRQQAFIEDGGVLKGTGTLTGLVQIAAGATIAPGHSPGCLSTGNLTLTGTYEFEVGGTTACTGHDQIKVTGTVNVTNGTLEATLYNGFVPTVGQSYTIIENDAVDAVTGTFTGIAEGGSYTNQGVTYSVTYAGGSGNDVVLTVTAVNAAALPTVPNTGFKLLFANPLLTLLAATTAAGAILVTRKQLQKAPAKRR